MIKCKKAKTDITNKHGRTISWKEVDKHLCKPVMIKFWDHAMNSEEIECVVVGFLAKSTKRSVMIVSWDTELEGACREHNMEYFTVLKSAIIDIWPLRASQKWG